VGLLFCLKITTHGYLLAPFWTLPAIGTRIGLNAQGLGVQLGNTANNEIIKSLFLIVFAICASKAWSYTVVGRHYITDGTQSDVRAACSAAPDNGTITVLIPDGTYTWNKTLTIRNAIHLRGQNKGKVIIKDRNPTGDMITRG
jgi:hypothetical protein